MLAGVSLQQQWLIMTTWNKQTSTIRRENPSQCYHLRSDKIPEFYTGLYVNYCDFFYLKDFVSGIDIILLKCRPLRSPDMFLKPCLEKWKRENLKVEPASRPRKSMPIWGTKCSRKSQLPGKKWLFEQKMSLTYINRKIILLYLNYIS